MAIKNYSTTASSNTSVNGVSCAEGMAPSALNNLARQLIKDTRDGFNDKEWFILGDSDGATVFTRASSTSVTVPANITTTHHVGRRIKISGSNTGVIYGKIATSSFSSPNTTITFTFDSGSISASDSTVDVFVGSTFNNPAIPVVDEDNMSSDSALLPPSQQSVKAFVTSGTITQTNKTFNLANNTLSGTKAQFNTALSDGDFATIAGSETLTNKTLTSPVLNTSISGSALQDDDTFASPSASKIASSESIKAYVLSQFASQNFDVTDGSSSITIDLGSETLGVLGGSGITSSASGNNVTLAIDSTVATKTGSETLTNKSISGSANTLSNIATSSLTGTISNSQLATGIDASKIGDGSVSNTEFQHINSVSSNVQTQLNAKLTASNNLSDIGTASTARSNLGLGSIATQNSATVSISGGSISGISTPSNASDVANKSYVDSSIAGLRNRTVAECATTANIDLTQDLQNGDTIDGVSLSTNDRVLVKNQSDQTQNGLYIVVASGTASRDPEHDTVSELAGGMIVVNQGSTNTSKIFLCTTNNDGSIGSANITYTQVTPASNGTVTSAGITQSGSEFSISGSPITSAGNITLDVNRISATKIGANSNVSDTEFGHLDGVTSSIQTQLNEKATAGFSIAMSVALAPFIH